MADWPGLGDWPGRLAGELNTKEAQPCPKHGPGCRDPRLPASSPQSLPAKYGGQGDGKQPPRAPLCRTEPGQRNGKA